MSQGWLHWAAFIDTQNFLPLKSNSGRADYDDDGVREAITQPYLVAFGQASDNCGAYLRDIIGG
ncbi:MAG: hypothetical protein N5P05_003598 [Chroococcopsis gigantea SAG 12.99]|nr:hypothetical protein [Chroococcopsis gigantea SAG 12.99]